MKNKLIIDLNGQYLNYIYLKEENLNTINIEIQKDLTNYIVESFKWLVFSQKINLDDENLDLIFVNGPGSFTNVRLGTLMIKMLMILHPQLTVYETNKLQLYADNTKKEIVYLATSRSIYFAFVHNQNQIIMPLKYINNVDFDDLKNQYRDYTVVDVFGVCTSDCKENTRRLNFDNLRLIKNYTELKANYLKDPNIDLSVLNKLEC